MRCVALWHTYRQSILLLDDPLSAVDAKVAAGIFKHAVQELLPESTRILVTHQLQFARRADTIVVLSAAGTVHATGTYEDLLAAGHDVHEWEAVPAQHPSVSRTGPQNQLLGKSAKMESSPVFVDVLVTRKFSKENISASKTLIDKEKRVHGTVTWAVYVALFRAAGPRLLLLFIAFMMLAGQVLQRKSCCHVLEVSYYWAAHSVGAL